MNLRNVQFWKTTPRVSPTEARAQAPGSENRGGKSATLQPGEFANVIPLRMDGESSSADAERSHERHHPIFVPPTVRFTGLMKAPELTAFFEENYFGLGRHNGSHYRTMEALELGKKSLVAKFHNAATGLIERNRTKLNKLRLEIVAIEGVSPALSAQLRMACEHVDRDISVLQAQIVDAVDGKGWVAEALSLYQIGFAKGLREAVEFDLLTR